MLHVCVCIIISSSSSSNKIFYSPIWWQSIPQILQAKLECESNAYFYVIHDKIMCFLHCLSPPSVDSVFPQPL